MQYSELVVIITTSLECMIVTEFELFKLGHNHAISEINKHSRNT